MAFQNFRHQANSRSQLRLELAGQKDQKLTLFDGGKPCLVAFAGAINRESAEAAAQFIGFGLMAATRTRLSAIRLQFTSKASVAPINTQRTLPFHDGVRIQQRYRRSVIACVHHDRRQLPFYFDSFRSNSPLNQVKAPIKFREKHTRFCAPVVRPALIRTLNLECFFS